MKKIIFLLAVILFAACSDDNSYKGLDTNQIQINGITQDVTPLWLHEEVDSFDPEYDSALNSFTLDATKDTDCPRYIIYFAVGTDVMELHLYSDDAWDNTFNSVKECSNSWIIFFFRDNEDFELKSVNITTSTSRNDDGQTLYIQGKFTDQSGNEGVINLLVPHFRTDPFLVQDGLN